MSIATGLGKYLFRKGGNLLGRLLTKPGRLAEDFVTGATGRRSTTRKLVPQMRRRVKTPEIKAQNQVGTPGGQGWDVAAGRPVTIQPSADFKPAVQGVAATYEDYLSHKSFGDLNDTGKLAQGVGYALGYGVPFGGGGGLLGYHMLKGDGTETPTDANGVKNPKFNEEMAKFRSKYQEDKLGGDKMFSATKYRAVRDQTPWVRTAIEQIGKDKYVAMKQALADGKISAMDMHSALTDAIAELGDEEVMKQAGTEPYVLPGLASSGQSKRVIVIAPMKGKKGNETSMQALKYGIREEQGQGEQQ